MAKDIGALFKDWGFIFKLIEAILCLVALIFLYATNGVYIGYASTAGLFCLVTIGYLFILIVLIVVYIFDETHHLIELLVLGVGVFLNIIAGVLLLVTFLTASDEDGHGYGMTVVVAILLIANGVVMIFDFIREFLVGCHLNTITVDNRESYYDVPKKLIAPPPVVIEMSAEVENNKDEETNGKDQQTTVKQHLKNNWQIAFKIVELLLCAACMGAVYEPARVMGLGRNQLHHVGVTYTAYTGYMLINSLLLVARAIGDRIPFKTSAIFSSCGAALFLISGVLLMVDRTTLISRTFHPQMYRITMLMTSIVCALVNVLVFTVDAIFTYKRREDF